jgi:hypothetical protein
VVRSIVREPDAERERLEERLRELEEREQARDHERLNLEYRDRKRLERKRRRSEGLAVGASLIVGLVVGVLVLAFADDPGGVPGLGRTDNPEAPAFVFGGAAGFATRWVVRKLTDDD